MRRTLKDAGPKCSSGRQCDPPAYGDEVHRVASRWTPFCRGDGQLTRVWSRNPSTETSWQTSSVTAASVSPGCPGPGTLRSVIVVILFRTATKTYDGPHARVGSEIIS